MSQMHKLVAEIVSLLDKSGFCDNTQIIETSIFSLEQFTFKIRTTIFSTYTFQIRIYYNKGHYDYSYQIFDKEPVCRWGNKEHFPNLDTFPHHCHTITSIVIESPLRGTPIADLEIVLIELKKILAIDLP